MVSEMHMNYSVKTLVSCPEAIYRFWFGSGDAFERIDKCRDVYINKVREDKYPDITVRLNYSILSEFWQYVFCISSLGNPHWLIDFVSRSRRR